MLTRSVRLSDEEAEELRQLLAETGESEEAALHRATMRGIRDLRLEEGVRAFRHGRGSGEAARIAGLSRAAFLQALIDRDIVVLDGPSTLATELKGLARRLGDERLATAARILSKQQP